MVCRGATWPGQGARNLYVFIDRSEKVYALIAVEEANLKEAIRELGWVVHFRELGKMEKKGFLGAFPRRFQKIKRHIAYARFTLSLEDVHRFLASIEQRCHVIYCDDSIYDWLKKKGHNPIPESRMPNKFRQLMLLADNLANYCRIVLKRGIARKIRELEK